MQNAPSKELKTAFLAYMTALADIIGDDVSDGMLMELMRENVGKWNELEDEDIDPYEGVMFWVKNQSL